MRKEVKETAKGDGNIPSFYIEGKGVSDAFYKTLKVVHEKGMQLRTQYDRKDSDTDKFLDPPSRDAKVAVRVDDMFAKPSLPRMSYVQLGHYIAEMLGAKDHLVVPHAELFKLIHSGEAAKRVAEGGSEFEPKEWPYSYHKRLTEYPMSDGRTVNQLEMCVAKLTQDPITRRAVASTAVPEVDAFMASDAPCLRELEFRAIKDDQGRLVLNTTALWRSRDLYKAWCDNIVGLRNLIRFEVALPLQEATGIPVVMGSYTEKNGSLHIYGQDDTQKGMNTFFKNNPTLEGFLETTTNLQDPLRENIVDELKELAQDPTWNFPPESIKIIEKTAQMFESREFDP